MASFIKFLEGEELLKFDIVRDSEEYAYIAQRCGLETPYKHSIYLYGPYSKTLASHYEDMIEDPRLYSDASPDLPPEFDRESS